MEAERLPTAARRQRAIVDAMPRPPARAGGRRPSAVREAVMAARAAHGAWDVRDSDSRPGTRQARGGAGEVPRGGKGEVPMDLTGWARALAAAQPLRPVSAPRSFGGEGESTFSGDGLVDTPSSVLWRRLRPATGERDRQTGSSRKGRTEDPLCRTYSGTQVVKRALSSCKADTYGRKCGGSSGWPRASPVRRILGHEP